MRECTIGFKISLSKRELTINMGLSRSMSIYQFLIAVRSEGQQLMSESGETTSHLMGMFYRTLRMIDNGIKCVLLLLVATYKTPLTCAGHEGRSTFSMANHQLSSPENSRNVLRGKPRLKRATRKRKKLVLRKKLRNLHVELSVLLGSKMMTARSC